MKRIAFLNMGGIGDQLLFSPVIAAVRQALPEATLTLLLEHRSQSVVELLPEVDHVIPLRNQSRLKLTSELFFRLRAGQFDAVISCGSSPLIAPLLWSSGIPVRVGFASKSSAFLTAAAPLQKTVYASDMYFALAQAFLTHQFGSAPTGPVAPCLQPVTGVALPPGWPTQGLRRRLLLHPGSSRLSVEKGILKGWSAPRWQSLITALTQDTDVLLVGGPDDEAIIADIQAGLPEGLPHFYNLYGQTRNLKDLAACVQAADLLVCVDSAPLHLAVGLNTPFVALFGPTDDRKLVPPGRGCVVARQDLDCRPCLWAVRQQNCEQSTCLDIPVEAVLQAVSAQLNPVRENA
jgi:putative inorganic carbon (HCO3(-)) transporter